MTDSPQVSRTHLSILADLNNIRGLVISIPPLISIFTGVFSNPFGTFTNAPSITIITVTVMFYSFLSSLAKSVNFLAFFHNYSIICWNNKIHQISCFFFSWFALSLVIWPELGDPFVSQNPIDFMCLIFLILASTYTICKYNQIFISCIIPMGSPFPPSRASSCIPFLHSLTMWLIVLSLLLHDLHLLLSCI